LRRLKGDGDQEKLKSILSRRRSPSGIECVIMASDNVSNEPHADRESWPCDVYKGCFFPNDYGERLRDLLARFSDCMTVRKVLSEGGAPKCTHAKHVVSLAFILQ
jgi:hypothetical protein